MAGAASVSCCSLYHGGFEETSDWSPSGTWALILINQFIFSNFPEVMTLYLMILPVATYSDDPFWLGITSMTRYHGVSSACSSSTCPFSPRAFRPADASWQLGTTTERSPCSGSTKQTHLMSLTCRHRETHTCPTRCVFSLVAALSPDATAANQKPILTFTGEIGTPEGCAWFAFLQRVCRWLWRLEVKNMS